VTLGHSAKGYPCPGGAGSAHFGVDTLATPFAEGHRLAGSTLVHVDLDEHALDAVTELARRGNDDDGAGLAIASTTDRCAASSRFPLSSAPTASGRCSFPACRMA
jgi:Family 4 glycosyl hydrolase